MLEEIKRIVCEANKELPKHNLSVLTWGNVSSIDDTHKYIVIKPSGVKFEDLKPIDMVVVDLDNNVIEGAYKPSSDTKTHTEIYKKYPNIKSIIHTHSVNAVAFAQAKECILPYGTTHADTFHEAIKCTRSLTKNEVNEDYEKNTGKVINETIGENNPLDTPAILVANHGPFIFGYSVENALNNSITLEVVAEMAIKTRLIDSNVKEVEKYILEKHYSRKHGKNAYYGQKGK